MENGSVNDKKRENPFLGERRQAMWKRLKESPKKRMSKEELLKRAQEAKSKAKK